MSCQQCQNALDENNISYKPPTNYYYESNIQEKYHNTNNKAIFCDKELLFCNSTCLENYKKTHYTTCPCCSCIIIFDSSNIIQKTFNNKTFVFCSDKCARVYEMYDVCIVCQNYLVTTMIDGQCFCREDSKTEYHPTCLENYRKTYACTLCDEYKTFDQGKWYIACYGEGYGDYGWDFVNICTDCFSVHDRHSVEADVDRQVNIEKNWTTIFDRYPEYKSIKKHYDTIKKYRELQNKYDELAKMKYMCSGCRNWIEISDGLNIDDGKNLCNRCK
jgi:hypothetical protein